MHSARTSAGRRSTRRQTRHPSLVRLCNSRLRRGAPSWAPRSPHARAWRYLLYARVDLVRQWLPSLVVSDSQLTAGVGEDTKARGGARAPSERPTRQAASGSNSEKHDDGAGRRRA